MTEHLERAAAAPAARSGAPASHWAHTQERGSLLGLRLMAWIAVRLGRRVAGLILPGIALYFLLLAPAVRRRSIRYLGRAMGRSAGWLDAYRHFCSFSATVLDRIYFARRELDGFEIEVVGENIVLDIAETGRGAVLLGAHMGSFEALHSLGASHPGLRVAMAMYPDNAQQLHAVLQAIAPDLKMDIIAIGRPGAALEIRSWLDKGGMVGMLGDRDLGRSGLTGAGSKWQFLGREASFNDGPFRLALMLRRPVIFMSSLYLGGRRYRVSFEPLADFCAVSRGDDAQKLVKVAMQAYVDRLQSLCREAPYNWFNFHDFWGEDCAS